MCPQLKRFDVSDGPEMSDVVLEALRNRSTFWGPSRSAGTASLEQLNLAGCSLISSLGVSWCGSPILALSSVLFPHAQTSPHTLRLTVQNVGLTRLDLSRCPTLDLEAMRALNSLPSLTHLCLSNNPGWDPSSLRWLFLSADPSTTDPKPHPSRLHSLQVMLTCPPPCVRTFPSLTTHMRTRSSQTLILTGCNQFAAPAAIEHLSALTRLTELRFEDAPFTAESIRALFEVQLSLGFCTCDARVSLCSPFSVQSIPSIQRLFLPRCSGISEQGVMFCLTTLPSLHTIDITGCRGVTDRVLNRLTQGLSTSVRVLKIGA